MKIALFLFKCHCISSQVFAWKYFRIGSENNSLAPNTQRALIWTNNDLVYWRTYAPSGLSALMCVILITCVCNSGLVHYFCIICCLHIIGYRRNVLLCIFTFLIMYKFIEQEDQISQQERKIWLFVFSSYDPCMNFLCFNNCRLSGITWSVTKLYKITSSELRSNQTYVNCYEQWLVEWLQHLTINLAALKLEGHTWINMICRHYC